MSSSSPRLLVLVILTTTWLVGTSVGWDQLTSTPMRQFFPLVSDVLVQKLTDSINIQNTTNQSIAVLDDWIDKNWVNKSSVTVTTTVRPGQTTAVPLNHGWLTDKSYARNISSSYLEHRGAVKIYARYLYRATQILEYFNETQAATMRSLFWSKDKSCNNYFSCSKGDFLTDLPKTFGKTHQNVSSDIRMLSDVALNFVGVGKKLDWRFAY